MQQNKFCSPNDYERDAPRVTNKACRVRETFSCRIHRLHDTPFSYSHFAKLFTRVPTFAVVVYDKLFTGQRGVRGMNRMDFLFRRVTYRRTLHRYVTFFMYAIFHTPYYRLQ